jgi:Glycosyltransferase family 9 (heptosyltransferase)
VTRVYIAAVSFGLGDLVVSLPAVQALIEQGCDTWLVTRSPIQAALASRIAGLAGYVAEDVFDRSNPPGRLIDLRDHPLQRDHWWGSPEFESTFGPLGINEIVARICSDFAIEATFAEPTPLLVQPRPDVESRILLVAATDGPSKQWPPHQWMALSEALGRLGHAVGVVTRDAGPDATLPGIDPVPAPTPPDVVDVLTAARAVVGVDTGLTHIAAQQRTPTVMICRASTVFFRPWSHTRAVRGAPCDEACVAGERLYAYNDRVDLRGFEWEPRPCPAAGRCLESVSADAVMHQLEDLL